MSPFHLLAGKWAWADLGKNHVKWLHTCQFFNMILENIKSNLCGQHSHQTLVLVSMCDLPLPPPHYGKGPERRDLEEMQLGAIKSKGLITREPRTTG